MATKKKDARSQKLFPKALDKLLAAGDLNSTLEPVVHLALRAGEFRDPLKFWRELRLPNGRCLESVNLWELSERGTSGGLEGVTQLRTCSIGGDPEEAKMMLEKLRVVLPKLALVELVGIDASLVPSLAALGDHGVRVICDLCWGQRFEGTAAPANVEVFGFMDREPDKTWLDNLLAG
jgi:hypothetical protein